MATTAQRKHVRTVLDFFHAHAGYLLYPPNDVRTAFDNECWSWSEHTTETMLAQGHYWQGDCSEFVAYVWKCVGLWRWPGPGYTGSDLQIWAANHWPTYTNAKLAYPGAGVIFGPGTGHHMAIVHTADHKNGNPLLDSHGRPGLDRVRLKDLQAEQTASGHPGVRFLSIAHL